MKNLFRNLLLTLVMAFCACVFVNATKIEAADEKFYGYSETNGTLVFEFSTHAYQSNSSNLTLDIRVTPVDSEDPITSLKMYSTTTDKVYEAEIDETTVEVLISDYSMRLDGSKNYSLTFAYTVTSTPGMEEEFSLRLVEDKWEPELNAFTAYNKVDVSKVKADLEILETEGVRSIEWILKGETTTERGIVDYTFEEPELDGDLNSALPIYRKSLEVVPTLSGQWSLYVNIKDYSGRLSGEVFIGDYTVDIDAPVFNGEIVLDSLEWTNNGNVTLPIANEGTLKYSVNGGEAVEYNSDNNTFVLTESGEYIITVTATDAAGNVTTKTATLKLDVTAPEVEINVVEADLLVGSETKFTLTSTDEHSGVKTISYRVDDGEWTAYSEEVVLPLKEGEYIIEYKVIDNAGNESAVATYTTRTIESLDVSLDVNIKGYEEDTYYQRVDVVLTVTTSLGIETAKYVLVGDEDPNNIIDITASKVVENGVYRFEATEIAVNGTYKFVVKTVDGNETESELVIDCVDTLAPTIDGDVAHTLEGNKLNVTFNYSDDYSGVNSIVLLICELDGCEDEEIAGDFVKGIVAVKEGQDVSELVGNYEFISLETFEGFTTIVEPDGEYAFVIIVTDNAGNIVKTQKTNFLVDSVLPTLGTFESSNLDDVSKDSYSFEVLTKGSDDASGVKEEYAVIYKYDAGGNKEELSSLRGEDFVTGAKLEVDAEGKYQFYYVIVDNSNNKAEFTKEFIIDRTAPIIEVSFITDPETWVNELIMIISSKDSTDSTTVTSLKYGYALEGNEVTEFIDLDGFQSVVLDLETGKYIFKVIAEDGCGNVTEFTSEPYYIDTIAPTVSITTNLENQIFAEELVVDLALNDADSGLDVVSYSVLKDGLPISTSTAVKAEASMSFTINNSEEGVFAIIVTLKDKAGNAFQVQSSTFLVDLNAPIINGLNDTKYHMGEITLNIVDATDVTVTLNGVESDQKELTISEDGYYRLDVVDALGRKTSELFVVNNQNKLVLKNKSVDVLTQRYLPVVKEGEKFYVNIPSEDYGIKNVLVLTAEKDGAQARIDQSENYIYLKSNVHSSVKKNGYKLEITDSTLTQAADENGNYGYVVLSVVTVDSAISLDIDIVVIDNEGLALGLGVAGTIALIAIFFVSRSKKTLKV